MHDATATDRPVLVGVEEDSDQQTVVRHAARQAELHRRPLRLLHVVDAPDPQERQAAATAHGSGVVEPLTAMVRLDFPQVPVTAEVVSGRPAAVLVERSSGAALLVLGHRGSGGFARLPLGSVSWQVATHADCPVIVVRPGETSAAPENRVVVGVDISEVSEEALDLAFAEADLRDARLELLHANFHLGELPTGPGMVAPDFKALDDAARRQLEAMAAERGARFPRVKVDVRVERVRPATILAEASRRAALLVVGSHGRTGLRRLMLGSVSAAALHTAASPVAVVPTADSD
ncbi:universal stress protein [Streptomyces sp. NPDC017993]|uniref:universal stress protein n=1 Tax=Streptomyces sp. NPDC017993 TaxID=3365027 RepID=UPI00379C5F36